MTFTPKIEPDLVLDLKPSARLQRLLIFIHGLALIASLANALPIWLRLVIFLIVACHGVWLHQVLQQAPDPIRHSQESGWQVNGLDAQILASTVMTTYAIFLHVNVQNKRRNLLIANDALDTDAYRQLTVRLKTSFTGR